MSAYALIFLGLPRAGTSRIASSADSGYMASLVKGFIPALSRRLRTVSYGICNLFESSFIVKPLTFINSISALKRHYLLKMSYLLTFTIQMLCYFVNKKSFFLTFSIDKMSEVLT